MFSPIRSRLLPPVLQTASLQRMPRCFFSRIPQWHKNSLHASTQLLPRMVRLNHTEPPKYDTRKSYQIHALVFLGGIFIGIFLVKADPLNLELREQINKEKEKADLIKKLERDLYLAIDRNNVEEVRIIVQKMRELKAAVSHERFFQAVEKGNAGIVQLLTYCEAPVNYRRRSGNALSIACEPSNENYEVAKVLIQAGVPADFKCLYNSAESGNSRLFVLVLNHVPYEEIKESNLCDLFYGATKSGKMEMIREVMKLYQKFNGSISKATLNSYSFICDAGSTGNVEMIQFWEKQGQKLDKRDPNNWFPLALAAASGRTDAVKYLVERHPEGVHDVCGTADNTPLQLAQLHDLPELTEVLLKAGSDINAKSKYGETAVESAATYNHPKTLELLLTYKPRIKVEDRKQERIHLFKAGENKDLTSFKLLLQQPGIDPKVHDAQGNNLLHHLCKFAANPEAIEIALSLGVPTDEKNDSGLTPYEIEPLVGDITAVHGFRLRDVEKVLRKEPFPAPKYGNIFFLAFMVKHGLELTMDSHFFWSVCEKAEVSLVQTALKADSSAEAHLQTGLGRAIRTGNIPFIQALLENGAMVDVEGQYSLELLAEVRTTSMLGNKAERKEKEKMVEVAKFLVDKGAKVTQKAVELTKENSNGPLHDYLAPLVLAATIQRENTKT